jgi:hypothetical protein
MTTGSELDFKRRLSTGQLAARFNLRMPGSSRLRTAARQWRIHDTGERNVEFWVERFAAVSRALRARAPAVPSFEYPYAPQPRFGHALPAHPELDALIGRGRDGYASVLRSFAGDTAALEAIPVYGGDRRSTMEPCWDNGYFEGLDPISLYSLLRTQRPRRLLEIGSGYSTKFARAAIDALALPTRILSIDPTPRSDVRDAAHEWINRPFEEMAGEIPGELEPGDFLFLDGSHRSFMNSDVTVFFLEVLPRLPAGVLVGIHDIFLPHDYPAAWSERYYNEQYLLAAYLLGGGRGTEVFFPNYYVALDPELKLLLRDVVGEKLAATIDLSGSLFWLRTTAA